MRPSRPKLASLSQTIRHFNYFHSVCVCALLSGVIHFRLILKEDYLMINSGTFFFNLSINIYILGTN